MAGFEDYLNEQLPAEEEAPEVAEEPTPVEPVAETEQESPEVDAETERARDEKGRFVKVGAFDLPEPVAKQLSDKDRFIGELQRELEEARQQRYEAPTYQDLGDVESVIDANPEIAGQIAFQAIANGDEIGYERTLRAWYDADPLGAQRFDARFQAAQMQWQMEQQFAPVVQTAESVQAQQNIQQATFTLRDRYEDFKDVLDTVDPLTTEVPEYIQKLYTDPARTQDALEATYHWAKNVFTQAAGQRQQEQAAAAHREKTQATVASASPPPASEGTGDSFVDSLYEEFRKPSPFSIGR